MNCAETKLNLEAFALGALEPQTHARVERHLLECDACRRAALQYAIVAHTLSDALTKKSSLVPPASLKRNLMAAAQADAHARAETKRVAPPKPAPVAPRAKWLLNPRVWILGLTSASALILALLGLIIFNSLNRTPTPPSQTASVKPLPAADRSVVTEFDSTKKRELYMSAPNARSNASGTLTLHPKNPYILFTAQHLPPLETGNVYILWTVTKGTIQPVGKFTPDPSGNITLSFQINSDDPILKRVFVTRELSPVEAGFYGFPSDKIMIEWRYDKTVDPF